MVKEQVKFKKVGANKLAFDYKGMELKLVRERVSRTSTGVVVNLYQNYKEKDVLVKQIGWIQDDGHSSCLHSKAFARGIITFEESTEKVLEYLDKVTT